MLGAVGGCDPGPPGRLIPSAFAYGSSASATARSNRSRSGFVSRSSVVRSIDERSFVTSQYCAGDS